VNPLSATVAFRQAGDGTEEAESANGGQMDDRSIHNHGLRRTAGVHTDAAVAAGLVVLLCVATRVPDRLIVVFGLHGWITALLAVLAAVNGARVIAQAPFTFARRRGSPARWAADQIKLLAATIVVGAAFTIPLYSLMRATPRWWLWAGALFAVVTVAAQVAMPVILRLQTGPLSPAGPSLVHQVEAVASRAGVDVSGGILLAEPAKGKGPRCNAYVVGWGATRRVVLESGIAAWPAALVDQVVAHELGHCRLRHIARRLPLTLVSQLGTLALAAAVLSSP
jgi:Zn-dependent protease with chaperone function